MAADNVEVFVNTYIEAWSTVDDMERRRLVEEVYATDAVFFADEPGDAAVECHGWDEIEANIAQVNQRLTQGAGLATESTGHVENHDLLRVSWQMTAPTGEVAMTGMNVLVRDDRGVVVRNAIRTVDLQDEDKTLMIGADRAGRLLEVVVVGLDTDRSRIIHAMRLRPSFYQFLEGR